MTVCMGQQLLRTGFDNASFLCLPFIETLALRPGASPDVWMPGTALRSSLSRVGAHRGSEDRVGQEAWCLPPGGISWWPM